MGRQADGIPSPGGGIQQVEIAVASTAINLLALAMPLMLLQVYDRIIPNHGVGTLTVLAIGVSTAVIAETILRIARASILGVLATRFEIRANTRAAIHLLRSDLGGFEAVSPGRHMERLAAIGQLRDYGSGQNLLTVYDVPFVLVYGGLIWFLGGPVVLVSLGAIALLAIMAIPASRAARLALQSSSTTDDERVDFLISALTGLPTMKMMALERPVLRRYEDLQERRLTNQRAAYLATQRLSEISVFVIQLATIGTVAFGSLHVLSGQITVGGLSACTLLVGRLLQMSQNLVLLSSRHQTLAVARQRLDELFALPQLPPQTGEKDAINVSPHLEVADVSFAFDGNRILNGASMEVQQGEIVGLVGANGSGKTTLLSIIAGLYRPDGGRVSLGGAPLDDFSPESLSRAIALVPQQETLFQGTILDNITMFQPELSDEATAVADRVGLAELLLGLPQGFSTLIGEGSTEPLPRGVAQRIALARALVLRPHILLFDDANSAVDDQGDQKFAELLGELRATCGIVIVSHRPNVLKLADRIYRLADGKADRLEGGFA